jgi:hypothetical protein
MYYPHPLIARRMRRFQILRQPWRRYVAATDPVAKALAERQYREAESAYRLMASYISLRSAKPSSTASANSFTWSGTLSNNGRGCSNSLLIVKNPPNSHVS